MANNKITTGQFCAIQDLFTKAQSENRAISNYEILLTVAISLADTKTMFEYYYNKQAILPLIEKASLMSPEELEEQADFLLQAISVFSNRTAIASNAAPEETSKPKKKRDTQA